MLINIDAYTGRDLQNVVQFMRQCESVGIVDIRTAIKVLQENIQHLHEGQQVHGTQAVKKTCPSCGNGFLVGLYKIDGINIMRCSLKCGYSRVIS